MSENELALPDTRMSEAKAETLLKKISETKIKDNDSYQYVADLLIEVKRVSNGISAEFEDPVKAAWQAHKKIYDLKKRVIEKFEEAEKLAKDKMENFDGPKVEGISKSESWTGDVIDASKIPPDYLMPDVKKLLDKTKQMKGETKIPGWQAYPKITVSVRA